MKIIEENEKHYLVPLSVNKVIHRRNDIKGLYDTKKLTIPNNYTLEMCKQLYEVKDIKK